jgi:glycosyltransferase involved in cell wall biosynthesis
MPSCSIDHIVTVIPARDEGRTIGPCLRSIEHARATLPSRITSSVVVVVDSSRDDTAMVAARHLDVGRDMLLHVDHACAGASRAVGVDAALEHPSTELSRIWVCSTDADSTVPTDWFDTHLDAAASGHIAVAGVVRLDDTADPLLREEFASTYVTHPDGTHPHIHGANLGFRADAYLSAGGWASLTTGEDHDLWHRLAPLGGVLASVGLWVTTASRLVGRAPAGFAADMVALTLAAERAA